MALSFVLDEHLRGPPWRAIQWHNCVGIHPLDVMRVGDPTDLPLGIGDPDLLLWAEREQRVLVTRDADTMPTSGGSFGCRSAFARCVHDPAPQHSASNHLLPSRRRLRQRAGGMAGPD